VSSARGGEIREENESREKSHFVTKQD